MISYTWEPAVWFKEKEAALEPLPYLVLVTMWSVPPDSLLIVGEKVLHRNDVLAMTLQGEQNEEQGLLQCS